MVERKPVVVQEDWQVRQELAALGLTAEIVKTVASAASAAKAESLEIDPCSTPGTLAYIYGVRAIRMQLLPDGWRVSRNGNVESTVNDERGIQLCFQNVDHACGDRDPQAISGKGSGSRKLIHAGLQSELFERPATDSPAPRGMVPVVWVICVSTDEKRLCAEVSCPEVFQGDQFEGFSKRILVVEESLEPMPSPTKEIGDDADDFEVRIAKK